jgi:hypothetical protein
MKLITEVELQEVQLITEGKGPERHYYVEGICAVADVKNRNGRTYPRAVLEREISRYEKQMIKSGRSMGELGHSPQPGVNLERVSHLFQEVRAEGNSWRAKARVLDTPCGKIARNLLESGCKLGFSTRGLGEVKNGIVQDTYHLSVLSDLVSEPSAPNAFCAGILEGIDWVQVGDGEYRQQRIDDLKKNLRRGKLTEARHIEAWREFLQIVREG